MNKNITIGTVQNKYENGEYDCKIPLPQGCPIHPARDRSVSYSRKDMDKYALDLKIYNDKKKAYIDACNSKTREFQTDCIAAIQSAGATSKQAIKAFDYVYDACSNNCFSELIPKISYMCDIFDDKVGRSY